MRIAIALSLVIGGTAAADAPAQVNLLVSGPSTVAVSSTVDNRAILPDHLVDGKLDTAWNSRTNQLIGAWISFRVPADSHVDVVKMTVGFTKKDPKLGDLFTLNPRIKRVRVLKDGKTVVEKDLDPEVRGLQDIPINGPGGDYKIEVTEMMLGTKKMWREIGVSELQVWGTMTGAAKKQKPIVRVGSLEPPAALTKAECIKAMFPKAKGNRIEADPDADVIVGFEAVALGGDIDICRIDHRLANATIATAELASVKRTPRLTVIQRITTLSAGKEKATGPYEDEGMGGVNESTVALSAFPLTATEQGLLVDATDGRYDMGGGGGTTTSTLYRVTGTELVPVLDFKSSWSSGEASDADRCTLLPPKLGTALPRLELECVNTVGRWHGEDPRGNGEFSTTSTKRYRWTGAAYEEK